MSVRRTALIGLVLSTVLNFMFAACSGGGGSDDSRSDEELNEVIDSFRNASFTATYDGLVRGGAGEERSFRVRVAKRESTILLEVAPKEAPEQRAYQRWNADSSETALTCIVRRNTSGAEICMIPKDPVEGLVLTAFTPVVSILHLPGAEDIREGFIPARDLGPSCFKNNDPSYGERVFCVSLDGALSYQSIRPERRGVSELTATSIGMSTTASDVEIPYPIREMD